MPDERHSRHGLNVESGGRSPEKTTADWTVGFVSEGYPAVETLFRL